MRKLKAGYSLALDDVCPERLANRNAIHQGYTAPGNRNSKKGTMCMTPPPEAKCTRSRLVPRSQSKDIQERSTLESKLCSGAWHSWFAQVARVAVMVNSAFNTAAADITMNSRTPCTMSQSLHFKFSAWPTGKQCG
eukprot:s1601_g23.t1